MARRNILFTRLDPLPENEEAIRWMRVSLRIMLYAGLVLLVASIYFYARRGAAEAPQVPLREIVDVLIVGIVVAVATFVFGNAAMLTLLWQQFAAGRNERAVRFFAWTMFALNLMVPVFVAQFLVKANVQPLWLALVGPVLGQAIIFMFLFARTARAKDITFLE